MDQLLPFESKSSKSKSPKKSAEEQSCSKYFEANDLKLLKCDDIMIDAQIKPKNKKKMSRSRSIIAAIGRKFGLRHFQHQHQKNNAVYSSQEDMSSSSGSYTISMERTTSHFDVNYSNSAYDLHDRAMSASPYSRYSPGIYHNGGNTGITAQHQIYADGLYRPLSALDDHPSALYSEDEDEGDDYVRVPHTVAGTPHHMAPSKVSLAAAAEKVAKQQKLNNINEKFNRHYPRNPHPSHRTFSVTRLVHHFLSSTSSSARSLSCHTSPARKQKYHKSASRSKAGGTFSSASSSGCSSSGISSSSGTYCTSSDKNKKQKKDKKEKKEKKQQSILRPPMQFVYQKGISGLYSRVPSYHVCYHALHPMHLHN